MAVSLQRSGALRLPRSSGRRLPSRSLQGPRRDLHAIAERVQTHVNPLSPTPVMARVRPLSKANRAERGAPSYTEVVRLVLATRLGAHRPPGRIYEGVASPCVRATGTSRAFCRSHLFWYHTCLQKKSPAAGAVKSCRQLWKTLSRGMLPPPRDTPARRDRSPRGRRRRGGPSSRGNGILRHTRRMSRPTPHHRDDSTGPAWTVFLGSSSSREGSEIRMPANARRRAHAMIAQGSFTHQTNGLPTPFDASRSVT